VIPRLDLFLPELGTSQSGSMPEIEILVVSEHPASYFKPMSVM